MVEVHKSQSNATLWYRVGKVNGDEIHWANNKESIEYDTGVDPSVAITDDGLVVAVHRSPSNATLWYRVGRVKSDGTIWVKDDQSKSVKYDDGLQPSVAITNDGLVVEVHRSEGFIKNNLWYRGTGQVNNMTIDGWEYDEKKSKSYSFGAEPKVACNGDLAVETHRDESELSYSVLTLPAFRPNWTVLEGENSYCYCACNSATDNKDRHASSHTMNLKEGAPYFYAVLTKDDDSIDFPTGAILTIEGPDGTKYDRDIQEENKLVIMSGSSVRCLIVKDPKPGDWKMTMTVPEGVGFHCECNTVPSKDVYDTIINTLNSHKAKKGLQPRFEPVSLLSLAYIGLASIVGMIAGVYAADSDSLAHRVAFNLAVAGTGNLGLHGTDPLFRDPLRMGVNGTAEALAESSRTAGQRQQTEYEYNLEMPERSSAPYDALDRYNRHLTEHQTLADPNHPVEVMRHHIIPDTRLRDLWNRALEADHLPIAAAQLLQTIAQNLEQYPITLNPADIHQLRDLLLSIRSGAIRHNPARSRPDGFDNLAAVYGYLPGNLFIGPRGGGGQYQRTDDPGNAFEENANTIVGADIPHREANSAIENYVSSSTEENAERAFDALSIIAGRSAPYPLNSYDWIFAHEKYKLRSRGD